MEHSGEVWQEFDFNAQRIGGIVPATFNPSKIKLFGAATVMLYRYHEGRVEFLFQHRSKQLKANPDKWDVSAGGHINVDEPEIDAIIRETKEEIGVSLSRNKLEFSGMYNSSDYALVYLYFYDWTGNEDNFSFNDHEVEEVAWIPFDELVNFWPKLKKHVRDDAIYQTILLTWTRKIQRKYGNH